MLLHANRAKQETIRHLAVPESSMNSSFRLFLILTFIIIGRPQDFLVFLAPFRIALVFTLLTLGATLINGRIRISVLRKYREVRLYELFYAVMIITIPFAIFKSQAFTFVFMQYSARVIFFYLLIMHTDSLFRLKKVMSTLVWSTLFYGLLVILLGSGTEERVAYGSVFDPNDLAYYMVSLFPIALFFWDSKERLMVRLRTAATFFTAVLLTLMTQSRGGFVSLAAVMGLIVITPTSGIKKEHRIFIVAGMLIALVFLGGRINMERIQSIGQIGTDYNLTDEFGRFAIWQRGVRITLQNPLTGVGANNFAMAIGEQRQAEGILPRWQAPHNAYLQVVSETGFIGLYIFMALIIKTYKNLRRQIPPDPAVPQLADLKRAMQLIKIAFIGNLCGAFFLSQSYSVLFPLFFGLSVVSQRIEGQLAAETKIDKVRA